MRTDPKHMDDTEHRVTITLTVGTEEIGRFRKVLEGREPGLKEAAKGLHHSKMGDSDNPDSTTLKEDILHIWGDKWPDESPNNSVILRLKGRRSASWIYLPPQATV